MTTKGSDGLTGAYMYRLLTTDKGRYQLTTERLMSEFYRSSKSTATDGTFPAVCLSGIRTDDNTGTGIDANDASIEGRVIKIIVRPLIPIGSIVPDPRLSTTPEAINADIATIGAVYTAKSDFGFKDQNPIPFGHIVNCYFEDGSIANSDFTGLRFQDPGKETIPDPSYVKLATIEGVITSLSAFERGLASLLGSISQPPPLASSKEINDLAERFDKETFYNKADSNRHISNAHPEIQNRLKAFLTKSKDNKIDIYISSTHRTHAKQAEMIVDHLAGRKPYIRPAETSYHLLGLALDFNPIPFGKNIINANRPKQDWIDSGVVAIGESLGLRWGGHFGKYDPVHFDLGNIVTKSRMKEMVNESKNAGIEGTKIATVKRV